MHKGNAEIHSNEMNELKKIARAARRVFAWVHTVKSLQQTILDVPLIRSLLTTTVLHVSIKCLKELKEVVLKQASH